MDIINEFKKGKWLEKAKQYLVSPEKAKELLKRMTSYINKEGLSSVRSDLELMCSYVKDVISGKYKDYDTAKIGIVIAALLYVVSPIDLIPDVIPVVGLTDDVSVVLWALSQLKEELDAYKKNFLLK